jgi:hypothetical protein
MSAAPFFYAGQVVPSASFETSLLRQALIVGL